MKPASYIKHIQFDDKLLNSPQAKYLRNPRLLILLLTVLFIFGLYAYTSLPRRLNPEINIPLVVISTVLPGANPSDMESLVTIPIEDTLSGVSDIKTYESTSRDSVSVVTIEFNTGTDVDKATADVKTAVEGAKLPEDAQDPNVAKIDFERFPVWTFSLTNNNGDTASLITFSNEMKDRLDSIPSIDEVTVSGLEEQEIQILIKPEIISTYGVNPQQIIATLPSALKAFPAGNIRTEKYSYTLSIDPTISSIDDIRNSKLNLNGQVVNLSDVAIVSEKSKPAQPQSYVAQVNEEPNQSVSFSIFKSENANINEAVQDAKEVVDVMQKSYQGEFTVFTTSNVSEQIDEQYFDLVRDFTLTIILVFAAMLIFLGIRQAVVSALSIPLTFLISFTAMYAFDIALSFISLFSLLLVLGLLVDDTIVIVSAVTSYFRSKKFTPLETGLLVWRDFLTPVLTSTLTTVWAFLPLLLSGGIIGEFIKPIPIVASVSLVASFFVAMFITLPIIIWLLNPTFPRRVKYLFAMIIVLGIISLFYFISGAGPLLVLEIIIFGIILFLLYKLRGQLYDGFQNKFVTSYKKHHTYVDAGFISFEPISARYQIFIRRILHSNSKIKLVIVSVILFSIFSYLLVPLGFVKNEFFPKIDADEILISVELPAGTNIETTKREALKIFDDLHHIEDIETISLDIGTGVGDFGNAVSSEANNFTYTLVLTKERERSSFEVAENVRKDFNDYTEGKFSVVEQSGGPPVGADIQIKFLGPDYAVLNEYADAVQNYLETTPGITNIDRSIKPGTSNINFIPDLTQMNDSGVTNEQVAFTLRTFASGFQVASSSFENESADDELDITLRYSSDVEFTEQVNSLNVVGGTGELIPLTSLGLLRLESSPTLVTREEGQRTISVTASVKRGFNIQELNTELEQYADSLDLPIGYSWKTGGLNEENQSSVNSILVAMVLSFILILATMVIQFSSFRKAFIVLLVIPISISGVFIIFALTNTPLSFPALVGVLALFGIVVKNSILIVDKIQANEKTNMDFSEGVAEGSASRLEPIALTSLTAILGLLPITLSDPLWRGLGGAIISGLTFSGTIMLFFIPVVYYLIFEGSQGKKKSSRQN